MKNIDVIKSFLNRNPNETTNIKSSANRLYSYSTCIAEWWEGQLLVNITKYSTTTSRHQSMFQRELLNRASKGTIFEIINKSDVLRGAHCLSNI